MAEAVAEYPLFLETLPPVVAAKLEKVKGREEVVRIHGLDKIPAVAMERDGTLPQPALNVQQRHHALARRTLAGRGMVEAVTYSFLSAEHADLFGGVPDTLKLANPISADLDVMRPSLLPNLIAAAGRNDNRGLKDADLFEVGPRFRGDANDGVSRVVRGDGEVAAGECGRGESGAYEAEGDC